MKQVLAMGEALIDFIPAQRDCLLKEVESFTRVCGGAPANVAAAAAKLGGESRMVTQLGKDAFGDYIVDTLQDAGVDTSCILRTDEANTALAFVSLKADGKVDEEYGAVCGIKVVDETDDLMFISSDGVIIRVACSEIREMGRTAKGVRVMRVSEGQKVVAFTRTEASQDEDDAEGTPEGAEQPSAEPEAIPAPDAQNASETGTEAPADESAE